MASTLLSSSGRAARPLGLADDAAASTSGRCGVFCRVSRTARSSAKRAGTSSTRLAAASSDFALWRGPLPDYNAPGVVPGFRTLATPRLTAERVRVLFV